AAVDVLEPLPYRIDDGEEAAICGTGKWFLNEERATQITHQAVQSIEIVDKVIRELTKAVGVHLGIIQSSGKMMQYCSIQFRRGHAEPLSGDRTLRKRFPTCSRREWDAADSVPIREPFLTHSRMVWVSFAHHRRTIREPGQPSGWPDWPMGTLSEPFPAFPIRDRDVSHLRLRPFPFSDREDSGSLPIRRTVAPREDLSRFSRKHSASRRAG